MLYSDVQFSLGYSKILSKELKKEKERKKEKGKEETLIVRVTERSLCPGAQAGLRGETTAPCSLRSVRAQPLPPTPATAQLRAAAQRAGDSPGLFKYEL